MWPSGHQLNTGENMVNLSELESKAIARMLGYWGVDEATATKNWIEAKEKALKAFPESAKNEKILVEKCVLIATAQIRPLSYAMGKSETFKGILVSVETPRDLWGTKRKASMAAFEKLKSEGRDQEAFATKLVGYDKMGNIVPLCPPLKSDGQPSKKAGEPMPAPEESQMQNIFGITYKSAADKKVPCAFVLEVQGPSCITTFSNNVVYEFQAINKTEEGQKVMSLKTNNTTFKPSSDDFLSQGIAKYGIPVMVEKLFSEMTITQKDLQAFETIGEIPDNYKRGVIVKNAAVTYINLQPNDKGNIKLNIERKINLDDPNDVPLPDERATMCIIKDGSINIDFAPGSVVMVAGRASIMPPRNPNEKGTLLMMTSNVIPYPNAHIKAQPAQKYTPADVPEEAPKAVVVPGVVTSTKVKHVASVEEEDLFNV
jgi:hypothetical protein